MRYKKHTSPAQKVAVARKLHGYKDYSFHMTHVYQRTGAFDKVPHIALSPGIYIIRPEDLKVFQPFKKFARVESREIVLTAADVKALKKTGDGDEN